VEEMQMLPILNNSYSTKAYDVSSDGNIIVGETSLLTTGSRALRWQWNSGVEDLNAAYASLLQDGSLFTRAKAISSDGRYIVGQGIHASVRREEAFLLDTWIVGDTNGDCTVDDSDLLAVLFAFGTQGTGVSRHEDINHDGIVDDADLL
jgi:uncharacterized membrane protein